DPAAETEGDEAARQRQEELGLQAPPRPGDDDRSGPARESPAGLCQPDSLVSAGVSPGLPERMARRLTGSRGRPDGAAAPDADDAGIRATSEGLAASIHP